MKKVISACLITSMLAAPCASYTSAFSFKEECYDISLCKKVWDHPIISAAGAFIALHLADKAIGATKKKIDATLDFSGKNYKGGYTHKEKGSSNNYSLPIVTYGDIYNSEPQFQASPLCDKDCNVYYSSTGKFQLNLNETQKKSFSDRGYISVKLRDIPQKEMSNFKKPFVWAYGKITGKEPYDYNKFYIKGPNLVQPTIGKYIKQFLPFVHSPKVPLLPVLKSLLPWNEKDFVKINYGIVLTNKDEEAALNFQAPKEGGFTKEYLAMQALAKKQRDNNIFDSIKQVEITSLDSKKNINERRVIGKIKPFNGKAFYTREDIKKLTEENSKKKSEILSKFVDACQSNYLTEGEIARLSLKNPEQTFRLVINNKAVSNDADKLSVLLTQCINEPIFNGGNNPSLLFDFEYVLPLPDRLQNPSPDKQPKAYNTVNEIKPIFTEHAAQVAQTYKELAKADKKQKNSKEQKKVDKVKKKLWNLTKEEAELKSNLEALEIGNKEENKTKIENVKESLKKLNTKKKALIEKNDVALENKKNSRALKNFVKVQEKLKKLVPISILYRDPAMYSLVDLNSKKIQVDEKGEDKEIQVDGTGTEAVKTSAIAIKTPSVEESHGGDKIEEVNTKDKDEEITTSVDESTDSGKIEMPAKDKGEESTTSVDESSDSSKSKDDKAGESKDKTHKTTGVEVRDAAGLIKNKQNSKGGKATPQPQNNKANNSGSNNLNSYEKKRRKKETKKGSNGQQQKQDKNSTNNSGGTPQKTFKIGGKLGTIKSTIGKIKNFGTPLSQKVSSKKGGNNNLNPDGKRETKQGSNGKKDGRKGKAKTAKKKNSGSIISNYNSMLSSTKK